VTVVDRVYIGVTVDEASADPGLPGDPPIAIDAIDKGDVLMVTRLDRLARSIQLQSRSGIPLAN
jgi:hypothetical protein